MPPEHGFMSIGHILHNVDLRAAVDRLRAATAESGPPEPETETCERCRGSGLLRRDVAATHPEFGRPIECPCGLVAARRRLRIWDAAQIPPKFRPYTLDSYAEVSGRHGLVGHLRTWIAGERWLLLTGDVGVGKSGIAASLLTEWLRSGQAGLYVSMPMFFSRIRATYRDNGDPIDELDVLGAVISVPLLVLDDLGVVLLSEWAREKLYRLITERAAEGHRTIVTSNLRVENGLLEAYVGAPIWDRIRGAADVVHITGESLRGLPVPMES
jgi:hypothetical protein